MDTVFQALAHAHRRRILDLLAATPGMTVNEIQHCFDTSRIAVMKHLRILEGAELLTCEKHGREKRHYFNIVPIQQIYERWSDEYSRYLAPRITDFKRALEEEHHDADVTDRAVNQNH